MENIGLEKNSGIFEVSNAESKVIAHEEKGFPDYGAALDEVFGRLAENEWGTFAFTKNAKNKNFAAVGHRIVHGGTHRAPRIIDDALIGQLQKLAAFAPAHLPYALLAIEKAARMFPHALQTACFDTAFHRDMPQVAQIYPLPRDYFEAGIRRYGFHGLSYEYILGELQKTAPRDASGRLIIAHLGHGASMAAIKAGHAVETTMGFTPTGGLVMSTRTGDIDPGVLIYLVKDRGMSAQEISGLISGKSGLLGVSGSTQDMKELLGKMGVDPQAALAVELFCYSAKKFIGALAAALGGLDCLVFTGGIGENAAYVRKHICQGLEFLGIDIDTADNEASAPVISNHASAVTVHVIKTNEEIVIARSAARLFTALTPSPNPPPF